MNPTDLKSRIAEYEVIISDGGSQAKADAILLEIQQAFPHSNFSQLYFHSDFGDRTDDLVEEVFERQRLFESEGEEAVRNRIVSQMVATLENPAVEYALISSAYQVLKGYAPNVAEQYAETVRLAGEEAVKRLRQGA